MKGRYKRVNNNILIGRNSYKSDIFTNNLLIFGESDKNIILEHYATNYLEHTKATNEDVVITYTVYDDIKEISKKLHLKGYNVITINPLFSKLPYNFLNNLHMSQVNYFIKAFVKNMLCDYGITLKRKAYKLLEIACAYIIYEKQEISFQRLESTLRLMYSTNIFKQKIKELDANDYVKSNLEYQYITEYVCEEIVFLTINLLNHMLCGNYNDFFGIKSNVYVNRDDSNKNAYIVAINDNEQLAGFIVDLIILSNINNSEKHTKLFLSYYRGIQYIPNLSKILDEGRVSLCTQYRNIEEFNMLYARENDKYENITSREDTTSVIIKDDLLYMNNKEIYI